MDAATTRRRIAVIVLSITFMALFVSFAFTTNDTTVNQAPKPPSKIELHESTKPLVGTWDASESDVEFLDTDTGLFEMQLIKWTSGLKKALLFFWQGKYKSDPLFVFQFDEFQQEFDMAWIDNNTTDNTTAYYISDVPFYTIMDYKTWNVTTSLTSHSVQPDMERVTEVDGVIFSNDCNFAIKLDFREMTNLEYREPGYFYSIVFTIFELFLLTSFTRHMQEWLINEGFARKTSIGMLLGNCIIEMFIVAINFILAFKNLRWFDYMMMVGICAAFMYGLIQFRVWRAVWKAQNRESQEVVIGDRNFRHKINLFNIKWTAIVASSVLFMLLWFDFIKLWVTVMLWFFVPQIYKNAREGNRNSLLPMFIPLAAGNRLLQCLYFFAYEENFAQSEPNYSFFGLCTIIIFLQTIILTLQQRRPKFFIPKAWRIGEYTYFRSDEEERQIPPEAECVIWLTSLSTAHRSSSAQNPSRTMHSPCGHMFHRDCLLNWMDVKMECPTCRAILPPIENED